MMGVFPFGTECVSQSYPPNPVAAAAYLLMRDEDVDVQFLIDIDAYKGGIPTSGGIATVSEIPVADLPAGSDVAVGSVTLKFADRDWVGASPYPAMQLFAVPVVVAVEGVPYEWTGTVFGGKKPYSPGLINAPEWLAVEMIDDETFRVFADEPVEGIYEDISVFVEDADGSAGDSMRPSEFYEGRVSMPLLMDASAPLFPEQERRVQRQFGAIEIVNSDAALDALVTGYAIDGRRVQVRFGPYMGDFADFAVVADLVATGWQPGEDAVRIALQDRSYSIDLPVQRNLYAGTGGSEGTAELSGKPKPLLYGEARNVTPVFLDPLHLIYQVHDGQIHALDAVYDRAGLLTLDTSVGSGGDVADHEELEAASVGASQFATCLAEGKFKLGSSPAGLITADARGDVRNGVYTDNLARIALRIIFDRAGLSPLVVDEGTFFGTAAIAGPVGLYVSQNEIVSARTVVDRLLGSVAGWWGAGIDGRLRAGRLISPQQVEPVQYLDEYDILAIEPEPTPIPRWRQRVGYARNWTIQRGEDLDVTVTDERRQVLSEPYSVAVQSDATLQIRHIAALDPAVVETLLRDEADALTVAAYLHDLFSPERSLYRVSVKWIGLAIELGACINIRYPRFGLSGGQSFIVVQRGIDADRGIIELLVWG